jgi:UDP-N-acetylglucosamine 3-dehydrogenase
MGQNHARVYSEIAELIGVADPAAGPGAKVADRFTVNYHVDYRDLLRERPAAVSVCVPTVHHFDVAKAVIEAGIHVLVEKPLCATLQEAETLTRLAAASGVILAVGHIERHNPAVAFAKQGLAAGEWGDLITASARRVSSFPERIRDVGVILDLAVHEVDVLRYLAGSPVAAVYALGGKRKHERFEDHANILLEFRNGVSGFIEVNWLTPMKVRKLALTCERNFVEIDYTSQGVTISSATVMPYDAANLYQIPFEYDIRNVSLKKEEPLKKELQDFLDAVARKRAPLVTGEDAVETLRVAEAAMRSHRDGVKVEL